MQRIWIVNHYAGAPSLGTGWRHWELSRRWAQRGVSVRVFTASTSIGGSVDPARRGHRRIDGVDWHFIEVPSYRGSGLGRIRNMLAFNRGVARALRATCVDNEPPDIVLASSPQPFVWTAAARFARAVDAAFVPEVRDLWPESLRQLRGLPAWHPLVLWCTLVTKQGYALADAVASSLPGIADALRPFGVPADRCVVIPNGVDLSQDRQRDPLPPTIEEAVARACDDGRRILLYVGALGVPNAMDQLFQAIALLEPPQQQRLTCLIIGDGSERARLTELARSCAATKVDLRVLGPMSQESVRSLIPHCHAGFQGWLDLPLYRHGTSAQKFSFFIGEGLPMVHAAPAGADMVARHGLGWECPAGKPADLAAAIAAMLGATPSDLELMSARCKEFARTKLDWDVVADNALKTLARATGRQFLATASAAQ